MENWMNKMQEYDKRMGVPKFEGWEEREIEAYKKAKSEQLNLHGVGINEVAFCDNPIHDFDRCPLIKQTDNCKNCTWYN